MLRYIYASYTYLEKIYEMIAVQKMEVQMIEMASLHPWRDAF